MSSIFPSLFDQRFSSIYDPFQSFFSHNSDLFGVSTNVEIDWKETRDAHVFHVDLPGLTKSDVRLQLHQGNNVLQITGERSHDLDDDDDDDDAKMWHCKERTTGKFIRQFRLPENAKTDEIKAELENGVLMVTVPKDDTLKTPEKHRAVEIKISGDDNDDNEHKRTPKGLGRFVCCKA